MGALLAAGIEKASLALIVVKLAHVFVPEIDHIGHADT
jgi:hypothetical protein